MLTCLIQKGDASMVTPMSGPIFISPHSSCLPCILTAPPVAIASKPCMHSIKEYCLCHGVTDLGTYWWQCPKQCKKLRIHTTYFQILVIILLEAVLVRSTIGCQLANSIHSFNMFSCCTALVISGKEACQENLKYQ